MVWPCREMQWAVRTELWRLMCVKYRLLKFIYYYSIIFSILKAIYHVYTVLNSEFNINLSVFFFLE